MGSVLFSSGKGKIRPHANGGFEWWEKGLVVFRNHSRRPGRSNPAPDWGYAGRGRERGGAETHPPRRRSGSVVRLPRERTDRKQGTFTFPPDLGFTSLNAYTRCEPWHSQADGRPCGLKWNMRGHFSCLSILSWSESWTTACTTELHAGDRTRLDIFEGGWPPGKNRRLHRTSEKRDGSANRKRLLPLL